MEKYTTQIRLNSYEAIQVIKTYYPNHIDFDTELLDRYKEMYKPIESTHRRYSRLLFILLTSPRGTVFIFEPKPYGYIVYPLLEYTTMITHMVGFTSETIEHVCIAKQFLISRTKEEFFNKYPIKNILTQTTND